MPRVTDPTKIVTDPVALSHLQRMGKVVENWELWHDYGSRKDAQGNSRKEFSPYSKIYRNTDNPEERMLVASGLPMIDHLGLKCTPGWLAQDPPTGRFVAKNNVFSATIVGTQVTFRCRNDQPDGRLANQFVTFQPQLFLDGVETPPISANAALIADPMNPNYLENVLEWDYGIIKRWLRTVEGRVHGYWLRPTTFSQAMRMVYNQTGDYRLKLGRWRISDDIEEVPAVITQSQFVPTFVYQGQTYYLISDSATYNPDANPETTSVDGSITRNTGSDETWATIHDATDGTSVEPSAVDGGCQIYAETEPNYRAIVRSAYLFDTSALPDNAVISDAVYSNYGELKGHAVWSPTVNVFASTPASNTDLVIGDYDQFGVTGFSTSQAISTLSITGYNDWTLNASGLAAISKTGITKLALREAAYDAPNSAPGGTGNVYYAGYYSEQGAGFKPKLVVTYTVPSDAGSVRSGLVARRLMGR